MSAVSEISNAYLGASSAAELMKVLEEGMQESVNLADKFIKLAAESKVDAVKADGLGQAIDLYA